MSDVCLRCDWAGEAGAATCPRCGAPLFHPAPPERPRRAAARPSEGGDDRTVVGDEPPRPTDAAEDDAPLRIRPTTSVSAVLGVVAVVFGLVLLLLARGGPSAPDPPRSLPSSAALDRTAGILVYAVPDGSGAAGLWLWHLAEDEVTQGPLIREPLTIVSVRSPSYGWLGFSADLGNGVREAAVLDSLEPDAEAERVGTGDLVAWAREGGTAILLDRGPLLDRCRRRIEVVAVHLEGEGSEVILDDTICGDVLSVGRTSLGYFLTRQRRGGADVVGAGYDDAGVLLADHGLIAISPGGEMLVTPSAGFLGATSPGGPRDEAPRVAGAAALFTQFGGRPQPYLVRGSPLFVDDVLAYAPGSESALVVGGLAGEDPGLWEVPFGIAGTGSLIPRFIGEAEGFTAAAYVGDGSAFVVTGGRLWQIREHRMRPVDVPAEAPVPSGPLVWVLREPLTEL